MTADDRSALSTVKRYAESWLQGDAATLVALYHDDVVLHYYGSNPLSGDHTGKPAALAALAKISQLVKRRPPEIHDVLGGEHHAAILARERWTVGEKTHELRRVLVYHVRDGKISECWIYDEDQPLVDAILSGAMQQS